MIDPMDERLRQEVLALLDANRKIDAIRILREQTGLGLKEAKETVEAWERGITRSPAAHARDSETLETEIADILVTRGKLPAIKEYRLRTGTNLSHAKTAVERIASQRGIEVPTSWGCLPVVLALVGIFVSTLVVAEERDLELGSSISNRGITTHQIVSTKPCAVSMVRVLRPAEADEKGPDSVVYVLPVEKELEDRYGDGLAEIQRLKLSQKYNAIFVAPSFSRLPWFADHPADASIQQERDLLRTMAIVERHYSVPKSSRKRLLLGFSKSGWGAWSLLLRHPDRFGRAAAWDAPMMMDRPGMYGSGEIFGTPENFAEYRISTLIERRARELAGTPRLILTGYGSFRDHHQRVHELLTKQRIPHVYRDGPVRKHDWSSGWVEEAAGLLFASDEELTRMSGAGN